MDAKVEASEGKRDRVFLESLVDAIMFPLQNLRDHSTHNTDVLTRAIRIGLVFLWKKKVSVNGVTLSKWSKVRAVLKEEVAKGHAHLFERPDELKDESVSVEEVAKQVLMTLNASDPEAAQDDAHVRALHPSLIEFDREDFVLPWSRFYQDNHAATSINLQPAYLNVARAVLGQISVVPDKLDTVPLLQIIVSEVFRQFPCEWGSFGVKVMELAQQDFSASEISFGIFQHEKDISFGFGLRVKYTMAMLEAR